MDDTDRGHEVARPAAARAAPGTLRRADSADLDHLAEFVRSRAGVEAFLEPRTTVTETTVVLVAATGEWTRRRVEDERAAQSFAKKHASRCTRSSEWVPAPDAGVDRTPPPPLTALHLPTVLRRARWHRWQVQSEVSR